MIHIRDCSPSVAQDADDLTLARYRPDDYRLDGQGDSRARGLAGLLRTSLLKRFESSVDAFRLTLQKMIEAHESFFVGLNEGVVAVPGTRGSRGSEADDPAELARALGRRERPLEEYRAEGLREDVEADLERLRGLLTAVAGAVDRQRSQAPSPVRGTARALGPEKAIIFTYYADTAAWIERAIVADAGGALR